MACIMRIIQCCTTRRISTCSFMPNIRSNRKKALDKSFSINNREFLLKHFRDEKEPLKEEKKITPIIDSGLRRETSITFDGKRSVSKTGFVGKDSAV